MSDRRAFLAGLAALPLVGGGVKILGAPTAADVVPTIGLLQNYEGWLSWERFRLHHEMYGPDVARNNTTMLACAVPAYGWHEGAGYPECGSPSPSTRAALVLATVGCPLGADTVIRRGRT